MARSGDELTNARGDRLVFVRTAAGTAGDLLEMEATYAARGEAPPLHLHPHQEGTFHVLEGALRTTIGGDTRRFEAGETFVVPAGTAHTMHADADVPTRFTWRVRPALSTEDFFAATWGLARTGRTDAHGRPNLLQAAVLMQAYAHEFRLLRPPRWVQVPVFALLGTIGRLAGYRAWVEPDAPADQRESPPSG
jgi:mannose-6-phosphate isomerase-like protein (cupin superfamily)